MCSAVIHSLGAVTLAATATALYFSGWVSVVILQPSFLVEQVVGSVCKSQLITGNACMIGANWQ
jgi:hypothetical protein